MNDCRKIKNYLRKNNASTIDSNNKMRLKLQRLFYYDIDGIPIAILKCECYNNNEEFMIFSYNKYKMPVHKDIRIVFNNINKSYEKVRDYIEDNNMTFEEVCKIIKQSTPITNRLIMEQN